jgi:hypothetical protein
MKNKIIIFGFCLLVTGLIFSGCEEQIVNQFDTESSLFFYNGNYNLAGEDQVESYSYSFFYTGSTVTQDTVWVDIRLTGFPSDRDRDISLVQFNADSTDAAIAGTHYVAFDDPTMKEKLIMPANNISVLIPIIINKTEDMETNEFTLDFGFEANDYFVDGLEELSTFTVTMTAMAVKPPAWDYYYDLAFGEWGQAKMKFLIDYVKLTDFAISMDDSDLRKYYNMKSRALLEEYEEEYGPIYENDGVTKVIFP